MNAFVMLLTLARYSSTKTLMGVRLEWILSLQAFIGSKTLSIITTEHIAGKAAPVSLEVTTILALLPYFFEEILKGFTQVEEYLTLKEGDLNAIEANEEFERCQARPLTSLSCHLLIALCFSVLRR